MKSEADIIKAVEDYTKLPATKLQEKYGLDTMREAVGFVKALRWVLQK